MHPSESVFEHERLFLAALESNFSSVYNFKSVDTFKQVLEERFSQFKIEVRKMVIGLKGNDRQAYLDEIGTEIKQVIEKFESHTLNSFRQIQFRCAHEALHYVTKQQHRYVKNKKSSDVSSQNTSTLLSFYYRESDTDALAFIYKNLNQVVNFIDTEKTGLSEFIEIFTAENLSLLPTDKQIHCNCQTNEAAYIFRRMQSLFDELTFSNIGKSGCFYSRNNVLLTTSNLRQSSKTLPKSKEAIDAVMRKIIIEL